MFEAGDLINYGGMGVCRIIAVDSDVPGSADEQRYYTLKPLYQECVIHIPVGSTKVFMRPVITKEEAERLIDLIPTIRAEPYHSKVVNQLAGHYEASLRTYDCEDLIELTMSIYAKKLEVEEQKRKFGAVDERFMKRAEELLYGELAAVLEIPKDDVPDYIAARIEGKAEQPD